ncbi:hypothetical protein [Natronorubrum thiooxidans]|uniref:Histidine kinase n=1 Tax=Natronorubrum thiooxidans TaxID=308853 RepID=A0A1N7GZY5_9EURY|nr:hypothetical protein [Natronorubrum thiooxidans]SIS18159.1 hypothetical protein SAMN05421752_11929 [Natronorubrum thiooxidans]
MATETQTTVSIGNVTTTDWAAGAVGGFVGSILFGLIMQYVIPAPMLEMAIPAMYGIEGPALMAGWAIHQFHGVVLGLTYVALVQFGPLREPAKRVAPAIGLGIGYGVLTTAALAVLVMPVWLSVLGFPGAPPFPNVAIPGTLVSLVGHIVFAVPVALAYALVAHE